MINVLLYQILACTIKGKILKNEIRTINLKYQLQYGIEKLHCLIDHILCQRFKIVLSKLKKNLKKRLLILQWEYTSIN